MGKSLTITSLFSQSAGFTGVAFLCALTGYTLFQGEGKIPSNDLILLLLYSLILGTYFVSRNTFLEQKDSIITDEKNSYGISIPLIFSSLFFIITILYFNNNLSLFNFNLEKLLVLLLYTTVPFIFLSSFSINDLKKGNLKRAFSYSHGILLPGIYTCSFSFIFGWSLYSEASILLFIVSAYMIFLLMLINFFHFSNRTINYILLGSIIFALTISAFINTELILPLLCMYLLSLTLGVSEIGQRAYYENTKKDYLLYKNLENNFYFNGAIWSGIMFPIVLIILTLFYQELPVLLIFIYGLVQIMYWYSAKHATLGTYIFSLSSGIMLPLMLIVENMVNLMEISFFENKSPETALGIFLGITGLLTYFLRTTSPKSIMNSLTKNNFLGYQSKYDIFFITLISTILMSFFLNLILPNIISDIPKEIIDNKTVDIIYALTLLYIIMSVLHGFNKDTIHNTNINQETSIMTNKNNMTTNLKNFILTTRPITSLLSFIVVLFITYAYSDLSFFSSLLHGIVFLFLTMYGFVINDIQDFKKDQIANRNRPIAKELLSRNTALFYSFFLVLILFIITLFLGTVKTTLIVIGTFLLVSFYTHISQKIAFSKGIVTSVLSLSPFLYASTIAELNFSLILYFLVLVFIFGRELYMDAQDYVGDKLFGLLTIPHYIGVKNSKLIGWLLMGMPLSFLVFYSIAINDRALILSSIVIFISFIFAIVTSYSNEDKAMSIIRFSMISSLIPLCQLGSL